MFVFTDVSVTGPASAVGGPSTAASASTSIGSPSAVPVPCASMRLICSGRTRPSRQGAADDVLLGPAVGGAHRRRAAVLVDRGAADDGEHRIVVGESVGEPLEHDDRGALAAHEPVGAGVERLAAPVGRHHPPSRHRHGRLRREHDVDAAGEGEVAVAVAQALARRGATRRVTTSRRCRRRRSGRAGRAGTTAGWR